MLKNKLKVQFNRYTVILLFVLAFLLATDLVLKYLEVKYEWDFVVIPKWIWVESGVKNFNVAFGLGSQIFSTATGKTLLIVVTSVFSLFLFAILLFVPDRFMLAKVCLVMIVSGAIGNIVDRIAFGYVRDFVWLNMLFTDACCNFADFWIVIGGVLLMVDIIFLNDYALFPLTKHAKEAQKKAEEEEKAGRK